MNHKLITVRTLLVSSLLLLLAGCIQPAMPTATTAGAVPTSAPVAEPAAAESSNVTDGCITTFDANVDYFPQKAVLTQTDGFVVEYHNSYKVVTVKTPWPGATEGFQYALVQCGAPVPAGFNEEQIIEVPVKTIASMSTSYLPFLDELGLLDRLVAVDDTTYVNNPTVVKMGEEGKLISVGYGASVNVEKLLDLHPALIMTYGSGSPDYDAHPVLLKAGLKVVVNAEWTEHSPLGRAEWGKFMALFFNREADAEALFASTVQRYEALKAKAAATTSKPTVFTDTEYQGTWYVAGGQSFAARFMADAGATYLWADDPATGSVALAFEAVYDKAATADVWLNVGYVNTLAELQAADARYGDFAAFASGNVWNNNKQQNANGGNDYYESAVAHPDLVLADLVAIFHPELLPGHEFVYYQQLK